MTFKPPRGHASDFDFLTGEWRIANHRLLPSGEWDEFPGEATVHRLLGGIVSVEELRIPARGFAGMGLRLFDVQTAVWQDFWVNGKNGVLTPPGMPGGFADGIGTFQSDDMDGDQAIQVRGIWDEIGPNSCRWQQAVSRDGGQTWAINWWMRWTRA